jgi:hypothetical protein
MSVDQGKLTNFNANFYTGPVNGANNHTHQLTLELIITVLFNSVQIKSIDLRYFECWNRR